MAISLEKRAEKVGIILEKRNIVKAPVVRVGLALDISGSTRHLYDKGVIQEQVDRLLAMAVKFDDNGQMDMWSFTTGVNALEMASAESYGGYVKRFILENRDITKWGGTAYAPVLEAALDHYFRGHDEVKTSGGFLGGLFGGSKKKVHVDAEDTHIPANLMLVTDGENSDKGDAEKILRAAQNYPIYFTMVGVGDPREFKFLEKMADELPNVGFVNFSSLDLSDEQLYEALITEEFCNWVKNI